MRPISLNEDMHVHSTFSDGLGTLEENIARAEAIGLRRLGCVDHVRRDTDWLPSFVAAVDQARAGTPVELVCAVEAKILDEGGTLDLPEDLGGVDRVYAADHQFPLGDRCYTPREVRAMLESGELTLERLVKALVGATQQVLLRYDKIVIAHLFSILPKLRLTEAIVPSEDVARLAEVAARTGAWLEVDERWRCPSVRVARIFAEAGVPVVMSSDSHKVAAIGQYSYNANLVAALR